MAWEHYCTNLSHLEALSAVWKRAKNQSKSWNESFPKLLMADGSIAITDYDKAKALLEPYSASAPNDDITNDLNNSFPMEDLTQNSPYDSPITKTELLNALNSARLGAMGPDLIPYQFLQHLTPDMQDLLLYIFNLCFSKAYIPRAWKTATLLPLLKPEKPPNLPNSYRPIALASCTLKTLEKIIATRLTMFLELHKKIPEFQFGFRKGRGCTEALDSLISEIKQGISHQKVSICAFMDDKKV